MCFVSCTTSHIGLCLFLESLKYDFINSELAQLAEHGTGDPEVVSSNPTGVNF